MLLFACASAEEWASELGMRIGEAVAEDQTMRYYERRQLLDELRRQPSGSKGGRRAR